MKKLFPVLIFLIGIQSQAQTLKGHVDFPETDVEQTAFYKIIETLTQRSISLKDCDWFKTNVQEEHKIELIALEKELDNESGKLGYAILSSNAYKEGDKIPLIFSVSNKTTSAILIDKASTSQEKLLILEVYNKETLAGMQYLGKEPKNFIESLPPRPPMFPEALQNYIVEKENLGSYLIGKPKRHDFQKNVTVILENELITGLFTTDPIVRTLDDLGVGSKMSDVRLIYGPSISDRIEIKPEYKRHLVNDAEFFTGGLYDGVYFVDFDKDGIVDMVFME